MKKNPNRKPNSPFRFSRAVVFPLVFLILGFMLAYSYSMTSKEDPGKYTGGAFLEQEARVREELISQQERNKALMEELRSKQEKVQKIERTLSVGEDQYAAYVEEAEELRMLLGQVPVEGKGLTVTLQDGSYDPTSVNPNDYIVHESHVFRVINELYISGAEAVSINGQRIRPTSHIVCTGPVIMVDGMQYPAPFVIEAIGAPEVLVSSMQLAGGVVDQLVNDNIVVTLDEKAELSMPAINRSQES